MGSERREYEVVVRYSEFMDGSDREFETSMMCTATTEAVARAMAVEQFGENCRDSNVAWSRKIKDLTVKPACESTAGSENDRS